jgi:threonine dehydrogenase-like Zn-dependent dehydrogenase
VPTTTRQVVFLEGGAVAIEDVEIPDPAPNQILVHSTRSLISAGTEMNILELAATERGEPGYSMVGRVAAMGADVEGYSTDDRVLTYLRHQGAGLITIDPGIPDEAAFAVHIPSDVSDEDASFVVLGDVALHGVRRAQPGLGDSVAVFGQGGLGQMVTQFARMAGAHPVIAVDLLDERLEVARWSGATHTVNAQREDAATAIQDITGGGARVVFMVTRTPKILPDCMQAAAAGGTISMTGSPPGTVEIGLQVELLRKELTIIGTYQSMYPREPYHMFQWTRAANRQYILDSMARGEFRVDRLISHREPYTKAADLYEMIRHGPQGWLSIILQWDDVQGGR